MKTYYLYFSIIVLILFLGLFCSSEPTVKPVPSSDGKEITSSPRMVLDTGERPREEIIVSKDFMAFLPLAVEAFYQANMRCPTNFSELKSSGYLIAIPKCLLDGNYYHEVEKVNINNPSGFIYRGLGGVECEFSFIAKYNGELQVATEHFTDETWKIRHLLKQYDPSDTQVMTIYRFVSRRLSRFYNDESNGELPASAKELMGDWQLVEEGWFRKQSNMINQAHFELGIDKSNNRFFVKFAYTGGLCKIIITPESVLDIRKINPENPLGETRYYNCGDIPPDVETITPMMTIENLHDFYLEVTS